MDPYKKQIGGAHYQMKIQPSEFINHNRLLFAEGNAIKYIVRHSKKNGKEDLEKAKKYYDDLSNSAPMLFSHTYAKGNFLVQMNGDMKDEEFAKYKDVMDKFIK